MPKSLAIAASIITFAVMSVFAYYLKGQSDDFLEGFVIGAFGITGLIYVNHKLGVRLF